MKECYKVFFLLFFCCFIYLFIYLFFFVLFFQKQILSYIAILLQDNSGSEYQPDEKDQESSDYSDNSDAVSEIVEKIETITVNKSTSIPEEIPTAVYTTESNSQAFSTIPSQPAENKTSNTGQSEDIESVEVKPSVQPTNNIQCRKYDKKFYCLYCEEARSKLPDHLIARHKDEDDVAKYMSENNKQEKDKLYIKIRNLGDHLHNRKVLRSGEGDLAVRYRPRNGDEGNSDHYGPCPRCYGYYIRRELWRHRCPLAIEQPKEKGLKLASASLLLLPTSPYGSYHLRKVIVGMKGDEISRIAKSDSTIMANAEKLCKKHGHEIERHSYIRQKMRELARLLKELRAEANLPNGTLDLFFSPKYYRLMVYCSKKVACYDEMTNRYVTPSLALKLGHAIHKCSKIVAGQCIENRDREKANDVEEFQKLLELNWTDDISLNALKTIREDKRNKASQMIPLADDVKQLSAHLKKVGNENFKVLVSSESVVDAKAWETLNEVTLTQLIVFNRKRAGEVSKMKITDYRAKHLVSTGPEWKSLLSTTEKGLCKKYPRVDILGKGDRPVTVIFPPHITRNLDLLLDTRSDIAARTNDFLFPRIHYGSEGHIRGTDCLKKFANACGAEKPTLLRSTKLRKHIATMSQVLNLQNNELDILANFLGHDIRVHREYYRIPQETLQVAKVSKLLISMERGGAGLQSGQSLDEVELGDDVIEGMLFFIICFKLVSTILSLWQIDIHQNINMEFGKRTYYNIWCHSNAIIYFKVYIWIVNTLHKLTLEFSHIWDRLILI